MNPPEYPRGVEESWGDGSRVVWWAEAEYIGVSDRPSPEPGPEDVAINPHYAGDGPSIGV